MAMRRTRDRRQDSDGSNRQTREEQRGGLARAATYLRFAGLTGAQAPAREPNAGSMLRRIPPVIPIRQSAASAGT